MSSGVETSLDISNSKRSQRFLDFARNDRHEDTTSRLFSSLHIYPDNSPHSAAMNMAIDEALLEHATVASIRFYRWHSPALSFGYFGRFADVGRYAAERELVRRWTGGGTVFHGNDLTYSIVIPVNDAAFAESSMSIYEKIHRALREALIGMGGHAQLATPNSAVTDRLYNAGACFANPVRADVMVNGCKSQAQHNAEPAPVCCIRAAYKASTSVMGFQSDLQRSCRRMAAKKRSTTNSWIGQEKLLGKSTPPKIGCSGDKL